MDPICIYGSEKKPEAPDWFEWTTTSIADLVPDPVGQWVQFIFTLGGLPAGQQRTEAFCSTEILTPLASQADWNLVTTGQIPAAILTGAFERVIGDIKRQAWATLCVCSPQPYTPPSGDHLWEQTFGPFTAGTSGTFTCTGMPPAAHIETIGWEDMSPVPSLSGDNYVDLHLPWVNGDTFFMRTADGFAAGTYSWQMGDNQEIGSGAAMGGTYHAAGGPLTFTIYMDGTPDDGPPYEPDDPEIPDYDPPDTDECTLEELCGITARIYVQGFSTLIEVLRNQGLLNAIDGKVDDLQESADSILANLAAMATVVYDVQATAHGTFDRAELARRDANYLRRSTFYEGGLGDGGAAGATGEGQWTSSNQLIGVTAHLDTVPDGLGHTGEGQKAYYQAGYVQFASNGWWTRKYPLVSVQTYFDDIPPGCYIVYYNLAPGVVATFAGIAAYDDSAHVPITGE